MHMSIGIKSLTNTTLTGIEITRYVSKNIFITFSTLMIKNTNEHFVILNKL